MRVAYAQRRIAIRLESMDETVVLPEERRAFGLSRDYFPEGGRIEWVVRATTAQSNRHLGRLELSFFRSCESRREEGVCQAPSPEQLGHRTVLLTARWADYPPSIEDLIERSSLGTAQAKALRARTEPAVVEKVMARVRELEGEAERKRVMTRVRQLERRR